MKFAAVLISSLLISATGFAQSKPTAATTQSVPNPLRALTLHAMAMSGGDPDAVRKFYIAQNPTEQSIVDAYASVAGSIYRLQKACEKKWGKESFRQIGFGQMFNDEIARLEKARVQFQNNEAQIFLPKT